MPKTEIEVGQFVVARYDRPDGSWDYQVKLGWAGAILVLDEGYRVAQGRITDLLGQLLKVQDTYHVDQFAAIDAQRGPRPKPTALRVLHGDRRDRRPSRGLGCQRTRAHRFRRGAPGAGVADASCGSPPRTPIGPRSPAHRMTRLVVGPCLPCAHGGPDVRNAHPETVAAERQPSPTRFPR